MTIVLYLYASLLLLCIASIPVYIFIITVRRVDSSIYEDSIGDADLGDSSSSTNSLIYALSGVRNNSTTRSWAVNTSHHLQDDGNDSSELLQHYRYKLLKLQNYQSHLTAAHASNGSNTGRLIRGSRSFSHSRAARNDSSMNSAAASNRSSSVHQTNKTRSKLAYLKHPPSISFEHLRIQAFSDEYDAFVGQRHLDQSRKDQLRNMTTTRLHHSMLRRQYAHYFYNLSLQRHINRVHAVKVSRLHLIRIPKASSSSLSMVARRMVGCHPPGPCCKVRVDCNSG
jgi:hypothetical protein